MLSKEKAAPAKADRAENSVLFSLKELRQLEDERVKAEAAARKAQEEAERQAKAEAEQRRRDEAARRAREDEERRQRAENEREARQREDRLRVEEAERRARVEGELRLREQQRLEQQQRARSGRSAWTAAAAGTALLLAVGGGLATWAARRHQAEKTALEQEIAHQTEQTRLAQQAFDARIRALEEKARRYLNDAKTAKDQARILSDLQRQKEAIEAARPHPPRRTAPATPPTAAPPKSPLRVPQKRDIDETPLGGLPDSKSGGF